jgi:hypothetical protein
MRCIKARRWASDEIDGALDARRSARLRAHLDNCAACREVREEFAAIARNARELRTPEPSPDAWGRIRASLATTRAGSAAAASVLRPAASFAGRAFGLRTVATAAAAVLLVAGGVVLGLLVGRRGPVPASSDPESATLAKIDEAERYYQLAIKSLAEAFTAGKGSLEPAIAEMFERNIDVIDASIQACRLAVTSEPDDLRARDYLLGAYREKMQFLDTILEFQKTANLRAAESL